LVAVSSVAIGGPAGSACGASNVGPLGCCKAALCEGLGDRHTCKPARCPAAAPFGHGRGRPLMPEKEGKPHNGPTRAEHHAAAGAAGAG
jgi:hypothetical protein